MDDIVKNPFISDRSAKVSKYAVELLGYPGRMLYPNKRMGTPTTIFNANIFNSKAEKIWYGDIDIERFREELVKLSDRLGSIHVLAEFDGRFMRSNPTIGYVMSNAAVIIEDQRIIYGNDFAVRVKALQERADAQAKEGKRSANRKGKDKERKGE